MNDIVNVQQVNEEVIELIDLLEAAHQSNKEKCQVIKPVFERVNLYCDEFCLRQQKDSETLVIPLDAIGGAIYQEDDDVLFFSLKESRNLHAYSISNHVHIIYVTEKKRNPIVSFFSRIKHRIRFAINLYKLLCK